MINHVMYFGLKSVLVPIAVRGEGSNVSVSTP